MELEPMRLTAYEARDLSGLEPRSLGHMKLEIYQVRGLWG